MCNSVNAGEVLSGEGKKRMAICLVDTVAVATVGACIWFDV